MKISLVTVSVFCVFSVLSCLAEDDVGDDWNVNQPAYEVAAIQAKLDVDEGTWMSLDVSPDGKSIVFDLLGDIYRVPFEGGLAESLRSGHAWEIQPRYSPDGGSIAFTSDRDGADNIWVMDLGKDELHQVTFEDFQLLNNPSWSPDGQYIAAKKHFTTSRSLGTGEIWLYHSRGNEDAKGVQVVKRPSPIYQKELGEPKFSPQGDAIYFTQNSTRGDTFIYHQDSNTQVFQIKRIDLDTGEITKVAGGPGGAVRPEPSPDGKYLAYIKRVRAVSRLFMLNLASGEETMLVDSMDQDMQETWGVYGLYPNMDWTPDSTQIVFWAQGKIWRVDIVSRQRVNIPFQIADSRDVYPAPRFKVDVAPEEFDTKMVRFAQPSPDGNTILFESLGRLYTKRENQAPEQLMRDREDAKSGFDYSPVWSPSGKEVFFLHWNDQNLASIQRVSSRGGRSRNLNQEKGQYTELAISPDGKTLLYRKLSGHVLRHPEWGQLPGIYLMDIGTRATRFVSRRGVLPHFGPDNRIFVNERKQTVGRGSDTQQTKLLSMEVDGNDVREVAQSELASTILLAPDGKHVAFLENHHVFVSAFAKTGQVISLGPKVKGLPVKRLSETGGVYLNWADDAKTLSWSLGPELKSTDVRTALYGEQNTVSVDLSQRMTTSQPSTTLVLSGARLITMNENRSVVENGRVVISGNRIVEVGPVETISIPDGALELDLTGKTIIPGLIDIHAHGPYGQGQIIPQQNWNALAHLALGVTTLHNPSSRASLVFAAAEYAKAGRILTPRIFSTGEIVYGAKSVWWVPVDSVEDALASIRRLKSQGAISVKNYNQPRREQRQQVIEAARREGLMTVAEGGSLFHMDMSLIADGTTGIEHNVPALIMYNDVTQLWQQSTAGYTPTLVVTYGGLTSEDYFYQETEVWKHPILSNFVPPTVLQPRSVRRPMAPEDDYKDDDSAASAKVLLEAGVLVNTGGHGQREGLATHWEMWSFGRGGMSAMQALSTATINPAKYLAMDQDLGSLEVGKLADLTILDANPLDNIRNSDQVSHVVLNGRVYLSKTLEEVVTGDSKLKPFWWQNTPQGKIR